MQIQMREEVSMRQFSIQTWSTIQKCLRSPAGRTYMDGYKEQSVCLEMLGLQQHSLPSRPSELALYSLWLQYRSGILQPVTAYKTLFLEVGTPHVFLGLFHEIGMERCAFPSLSPAHFFLFFSPLMKTSRSEALKYPRQGRIEL